MKFLYLLKLEKAYFALLQFRYVDIFLREIEFSDPIWGQNACMVSHVWLLVLARTNEGKNITSM